nr:Toll/interleukin-1 receptor (TIR) domain-containing protein [Tanacetum cinerariifolium]
MECHKMTGHTAYPLFYDVEPTEVRKQSGAIGESFAKHENEEAAEKWREALKEAADLAGWELKNTLDGHEAKFINKIVQEISLELRSINFGFDEKYAFGRENPLQGYEELSGKVVRYAAGLPLTVKVLGQSKKNAIRILENCGFHAINGLKVLEQRSLITVDEFEFLRMHDHIEEMGKNIVRREHPDEPNKHSHLWIEEEIEDILVMTW